jgi:serine/threonine protein kinase
VKCISLAGARRYDLDQASYQNQDCKFGVMLKIMNNHHHPNVIRYFDFLFCQDYRYTIMEKLCGPDFWTYLVARAPMTESHCQHLMQQLLSALDHVHTSMGLIHRDIKPENLRFRSNRLNSELVLLDFGLSCPAKHDSDQKLDVVGTLLYVAPEIFSRKYTTQVDLWSSGVLLYILLTGNPPWKVKSQSKGEFSLSEDILTGRAVQIALDNCKSQGVPEYAVEILQGLLQVSPACRLTASDALNHHWFERMLGPAHCPAPSEWTVAESVSPVEKASQARRSKTEMQRLDSVQTVLFGCRFAYEKTRLQSGMSVCASRHNLKGMDSPARSKQDSISSGGPTPILGGVVE